MNRADPLAGLRDIHLPVEPSWWPPAPGWWLAALLCAAVAGVAFAVARRRRRRLPARAALAVLAEIETQYQATHDRALLARRLSELLKRYALARSGRRAAGLHGDAWLAYLDRLGRGHEFTRGVGRALATAPYAERADFDAVAMLDLARRLLARAPRD